MCVPLLQLIHIHIPNPCPSIVRSNTSTATQDNDSSSSIKQWLVHAQMDHFFSSHVFCTMKRSTILVDIFLNLVLCAILSIWALGCVRAACDGAHFECIARTCTLCSPHISTGSFEHMLLHHACVWTGHS